MVVEGERKYRRPAIIATSLREERDVGKMIAEPLETDGHVH